MYRKNGDNLIFYVPNAMRTNILRTCYDDVGDVGVEYELIKSSYWFPKINVNKPEASSLEEGNEIGRL